MDAVLKMRMTEGSAGYGIYIMLLELLRDSDGLKTAYDPAVLAWALHENDQEKLRNVCEKYGLFEISDQGDISCPWLTEIMAEHTERRAKLAEAGKKSAELRKQRANHVATTLPEMGGGTSNKVDSAAQQTTIDNKKSEETTQDNSLADLVAEGRVFSEESIKAIGRVQADPLWISEEQLLQMSDKKHDINAVAKVAKAFKMNTTQFSAMKVATNGALIGSPELVALLNAYDHCLKTRFTPKYPYEYFIRKISKAHVEAEAARAESARSEELHRQHMANKAAAVPMPDHIASKIKS